MLDYSDRRVQPGLGPPRTDTPSHVPTRFSRPSASPIEVDLADRRDFAVEENDRLDHAVAHLRRSSLAQDVQGRSSRSLDRASRARRPAMGCDTSPAVAKPSRGPRSELGGIEQSREAPAGQRRTPSKGDPGETARYLRSPRHELDGLATHSYSRRRRSWESFPTRTTWAATSASRAVCTVRRLRPVSSAILPWSITPWVLSTW